MAVRYTYMIYKNDELMKCCFSEKKTEEYARSIKDTPDEQIKIVRVSPWIGEDYVYYI